MTKTVVVGLRLPLEEVTTLEEIAKKTGARSLQALVKECLYDTFHVRPDLSCALHECRIRKLEKELQIERQALSEAQAQAKVVDGPKVFEDVAKSVNTATRTTPKPSYVDKRSGLTEEERFLKAVPYVANDDKMVTPELKRKVLDQARVHSEWLAKVQEPERSKLEAMLRSASR